QVAVVDHGEVLASGTVNELKHSTGAETVITVRYEEGVPDGVTAKAGLAERSGVSKVETDGDYIRVFTREPEGVLGELVSNAQCSKMSNRTYSTGYVVGEGGSTAAASAPRMTSQRCPHSPRSTHPRRVTV